MLPALSKASPLDVPTQELVLATLQYLGEPALLAHESREDYLALRNEFFTELKPQGALEAQFIEDVLYYTWDIRRLRQARTELIQIWVVATGQPVLSALLRADPAFEDLNNTHKANNSATMKIKSALTGNRQEFKEVERLLAKIHVTWAEFYASALADRLPDLERIDRLMDRAERSRQATLKDFWFLQATKAMALEKRSDQAIEDIPADVIEEPSK